MFKTCIKNYNFKHKYRDSCIPNGWLQHARLILVTMSSQGCGVGVAKSYDLERSRNRFF